MPLNFARVLSASDSRGGFARNVWCCVSVATIMGNITGIQWTKEPTTGQQWARAREFQVPKCVGLSCRTRNGPTQNANSTPSRHPSGRNLVIQVLGPAPMPALRRGRGVHSGLPMICSAKQNTYWPTLSQPLSVSDVLASNVIRTSKALRTLTGTQRPFLKANSLNSKSLSENELL